MNVFCSESTMLGTQGAYRDNNIQPQSSRNLKSITLTNILFYNKHTYIFKGLKKIKCLF